MITLFEGGAKSTIPKGKIDFKELIRLFTNDEEIKAIINKVRELKASKKEDEAKAEKNKLPYVTVAGEFSYRNNESLIKDSYTWLAAVDIDEDENPGLNFDKCLKKVKAHPSTLLALISPRGKGIKAIIKLKPNAYKIENHYHVMKDVVYEHLNKIWGCKLDNAQGKLSQPFYVTHDPNAYINLKAKTLDIDYTLLSPQAISDGGLVLNMASDLRPFVKGIRERKTGKWNYIGSVSIFVGGLYEGRVLKMAEKNILKHLKNAAAENPNIKDLETANKQIISAFNAGKKAPITLEHLKAKANIKKILDKINIAKISDMPYIRVGDDYFEKIFKTNMHGESEPYIDSRKRQTLVDDFGIDFLKEIPKYKTFCNVPSYLDHSYTIAGNYNLFQPFVWTAENGEWSAIKTLLTHLFNEHIEMGLDYIQLLYQRPTQILPVLCLVSAKQSTGKTTFIDFLSMLFKGNVAIISNEDFEGNFNQHFATKHVIALDESELHKEKNTSKIKQIATQKTIFRKGKFQNETEVDFFGKLIILSNNENGFINIKDEDVRYWVRQVPELKEFDPNFYEKIKNEIPAFIYFLDKRELETKEKMSRAWFKFDNIQTEALQRAKDFNKSALYQDLYDAFLEWFGSNDRNEICFTAKSAREKLLNNNNQYTSKYIGKVMREEFKINGEMKREINDLSESANKSTGMFFIVQKSQLFIENDADVDQDFLQKTDTPF